MTWRPVTEQPYRPEPNFPGAIDFALDDADRALAAKARIQLEFHRHRLNELDNKRKTA